MPVPLAPPVEATLSQIFRVFLVIGATSFGGGVIAGVVFLLLVRTKINSALLVPCGAVAGLYAFGLG